MQGKVITRVPVCLFWLICSALCCGTVFQNRQLWILITFSETRCVVACNNCWDFICCTAKILYWLKLLKMHLNWSSLFKIMAFFLCLSNFKNCCSRFAFELQIPPSMPVIDGNPELFGRLTPGLVAVHLLPIVLSKIMTWSFSILLARTGRYIEIWNSINTWRQFWLYCYNLFGICTTIPLSANATIQSSDPTAPNHPSPRYSYWKHFHSYLQMTNLSLLLQQRLKVSFLLCTKTNRSLKLLGTIYKSSLCCFFFTSCKSTLKGFVGRLESILSQDDVGTLRWN